MVSPAIDMLSGVHDAMNETNVQPSGDEVSLAGYDLLKKSAIRVHGASRFRVVTGNHVVGEVPDRIHVCAGGEVLECADPDMAGGDAGEDGAGQNISRRTSHRS